MTHTIQPIGVVHSPYKEKFAVPRQPNLVSAATGDVHLLPPFNQPEVVRGLEQFSHIWLMFIFHQTQDRGWHATVRPPRLGGNERLGVFATRSTFRPNPIGLSAVELRDIICHKDQVILKLGSIDLVDGTPIIDIKPYLPYSDAIVSATAGYAQQAPEASLVVTFSDAALDTLLQQTSRYPDLARLIEQVIAQDPRPAYKKNRPDQQIYGVHLTDFNIRWQVTESVATILSIEAHPSFSREDKAR